MTDRAFRRLFDWREAFDHPMTVWITVGVVGAAALAGVLIWCLRRRGALSPEAYRDVLVRWKSWLLLSVTLLTPILLGAAWTMAAVALLSLACYREFARVTGLFRERTISAVVVLGILVAMLAVVDHYERLFFAAAPLTVSLIAIVSIPFDRPKGYVQRVALGVVGFLLFGFSLAYLGHFANHPQYRPILLMILVGVEANDIFAYCIGKAVGGPKLLPATSPGKTWAGTGGALVLTTLLVACMGHFLLPRTPVDRPHVLLTLGLLVSALGQLGDLVLSSIKRDIGVKDVGTAIPGHGGLLDRFDSLLLVPPAVFHFLSYHLGPLAADQPARILPGG